MLEGKVVIVTGSAGGIGRHVAKTFAQERASVVVADVKPLNTVSGELEELEVEHLAIHADVREESVVRDMVEQVLARFGRIDVLVNNAAIVPHFQWGLPLWPRIRDMDQDFWQRVIQTNLGGTFLCTKHVLPTMEAQRSGHVVSTLGGSSRIGGCAYAVSKDAIRTFTRFVAEEERAFDVRVVSISPGAQIATEEAPEEARARMPGPDFVGNRFVLAAQVGMDLSGKALSLVDGKLVGRE